MPVPVPPPEPDVLLAEYERLESLAAAHGTGPARVQVLDWDLECPDFSSALSFLDYIAYRRLNDFTADRERPLILDCGANIGYTALWYKRAYPKARIVAFEPDPTFAPLLRRNLARNGADDVHVVQAAAWIADGHARWVTHPIDGSRLATPAAHAAPTVGVSTVDLRQYLEEDVDLLKIDVEGAEFELVPHLAPSLGRVKNIVVECHIGDQAHYRGLSALIEALQGAGFEVALNSYGPWRDLTRRHVPAPMHAEQYLLLAGWRAPAPAADEVPTTVPYGGLRLRSEAASLSREIERLRARLEAPDPLRELGRILLPLIVDGGAWELSLLTRPFVPEDGACVVSTCPSGVPPGGNERERQVATFLLEDGRLLGPPNAEHDEIRSLGRGRYSHWRDRIYWSASDNSDPNTNGRSYKILHQRVARDRAAGAPRRPTTRRE